MAVSDASNKDLTALGERAKAALASGDPAEAQKVVSDLADVVGTDGLAEIWKSG